MKHLLVLLFLLCSASVSAQDVIVKKNGSTILSKVLEVGQEEIKYKKYDNLDGPTYTIQKSELQAINYQNGAKDTFSATSREENKYLPNNQNDGIQTMNDRALLVLDATASKLPKKMKTWRNIGIIGGSALVGIGGILMITAPGDGEVYNLHLIAGGVILGCGVVGATTCLLKAYSYKKQIDMLQVSLLYQKDIKLKNGSLLSAGIDMINDRTNGNNTLGLGLRYNF